MIYTPLTRLAARIAYDAHHGSIDDGGMPYVFHPFHLAEGMDDETSTCVALLHDVAEHTDVGFEEFDDLFPSEVMEAVHLLNHDEAVDYFDYIRALKRNPVARRVKLADLEHNSDMTRYDGCRWVTDEMRAEWTARYSMAREILESDKDI